MRQLILSITLLLSFSAFAQETRNFQNYTLGEVYEMIENEPSDTFTLKNVNIILDTIADRNYLLQRIGTRGLAPVRSDSIEIHKIIVFENVFEESWTGTPKYFAGFNKVIFHKPVTIINSDLKFFHNHFKGPVTINYGDDLFQSFEDNKWLDRKFASLSLEKNTFETYPRIRSRTEKEENLPSVFRLENCIFKSTNTTKDLSWFLGGFRNSYIRNNQFSGNDPLYLAVTGSSAEINNNDFGNLLVMFYINDVIGVDKLHFRGNKMNRPIMINIPESTKNIQMEWKQFSEGIINYINYSDYFLSYTNSMSGTGFASNWNNEEYIRKYQDSLRVVNSLFHQNEITMIGRLNAIYRNQHDRLSAKASYIALKDLETNRLQYLYSVAPSFDTYFEWKINEFLRVFSDYGTKPSKAITMSVYVVLAFALVYLFFPNHWDSHGKNRIVDRFSFFLKYMKRDAGMHDVYLEERQGDILAYDEYKQLLESSGKDVPKFFQATGLPLYKWAISGTKLTAGFLSRVDVMQGTWSELPQSKRVWKSVLLISAFLIALTYDIFIKMLNALMLSINTFTTLGFGEIPIKGLPRYLAIIQGFIGWFMLTIFSVSLISQLLN